MPRSSILLAFGAALLTIPLGTWTAVETGRQLRNPCVSWGVTGPVKLAMPADAECRALQVNGGTRRQAVAQVVLVLGSILAASFLGLWGALRARPPLAVTGSSIFFVIALISMGAWMLFLLAGSLLLLAARASRPRVAGTAQLSLSE